MTLLDNLIAYWKLENVSDSTGTITDLTNNATVTFTAGKILNAGTFASASSQSLSHASEANLQTGDIAWTFNFWVKLTDKVANQAFIYKGDAADSVLEYIVYLDQAGDRLILNVAGTGGTANNFGSPPTGTYFMVTVIHASAGGAITIQVNNGTANSAAGVTGISDANLFRIGRSGAGSYANGQIDEVGFWKRALTAGEITELYNGGNGLTYPFSLRSGTQAKIW